LKGDRHLKFWMSLNLYCI